MDDSRKVAWRYATDYHYFPSASIACVGTQPRSDGYVCHFLDCSKWTETVLRQKNDKKKYRDGETTYGLDDSS
jgi:hypothetical protein